MFQLLNDMKKSYKIVVCLQVYYDDHEKTTLVSQHNCNKKDQQINTNFCHFF